MRSFSLGSLEQVECMHSPGASSCLGNELLHLCELPSATDWHQPFLCWCTEVALVQFFLGLCLASSTLDRSSRTLCFICPTPSAASSLCAHYTEQPHWACDDCSVEVPISSVSFFGHWFCDPI